MADEDVKQKTICIDFDGVIHEYDVWRGKGIFGELVYGAAETINKLYNDGWVVIIYTTRSECAEIDQYLRENNILFSHINCNPENEKLGLSPNKPIADVYVDDRAINFRGDWLEVYRTILDFEPWYKKRNCIKKPDQILEELAELFRDKNTVDNYGDAYLDFGKLCSVMWPNGLVIKNIDGFNKIGILFMILHKLLRVSKTVNLDATSKFEKPLDNIKDLAVYAAMLCEVIERKYLL